MTRAGPDATRDAKRFVGTGLCQDAVPDAKKSVGTGPEGPCAAEQQRYDGLGFGPCSAVLSLRLMGFSAGGGGGPWLSSPSENNSSGEGERCLLGARGVVEEEGV